MSDLKLQKRDERPVFLNVPELLNTLEEIHRIELRHAYETCPDCHSGKGCAKETGCVDLNRSGGTSIQKLVRKAIEQVNNAP